MIEWRKNSSKETTSNTKNLESDNNELYKEPEIERSLEQVTMVIKEGTLTKAGATVIIRDNNEIPYDYDDWYRIDEKVGNEWKQVEPVDINATSNGFGKMIDKTKHNIEYDVDWSGLYGELKIGQYRLVKRIYEHGDINISAEFFIK